MTAANQMFRYHLRRLHVIRADQVNIVQIAGAGGKNQRHPHFGGTIAQFSALVDSASDNHPVHAL